MIKNILSFSLIFGMAALTACGEGAGPAALPDSIYSGEQGKFHVQSAAVDQKNGFVYFSFTNKLVKTDLKGNLIGSVTGFTGHLGDVHFDSESGKIYTSLEYKNDAIGKGISKTLGVEERDNVGFYITIFDGSRIVRSDMSAEKDDVVRVVYLKEVVDDYKAMVQVGDRELQHRFACSGIDGVTLAPGIGEKPGTKKYLYVAYGIYGDNSRDDNDHQVILKYDISDWDELAQPHSQDGLQHSGPDRPLAKYFVKTGNTRYGIQNLAYDQASGNFFAAVYKGSKAEFPNYTLFLIDGHKKPFKGTVTSDGETLDVMKLSLLEEGLRDEKTGIRGWNFQWGTTGLEPLGDGLFYISHHGKSKGGQQEATLYKYRWTGDEESPFELVEENSEKAVGKRE